MLQNIKKHIITIIIFILLSLILISSLILGTIKIYSLKINKNKARYLNEIIEGNIKRENQKAYLVVKSISQKFASVKNKKEAFYFVNDGTYNYIVNLEEEKANILFSKDLENNPIKIYGLTKTTNKTVKQLAIDAYNINNEEENKITMNDYYSYFGDLYLDKVVIKK